MFHFNDLNFDFDGDGILDSHAEYIDTDGDGIADKIMIDMDGDGVFDQQLFDMDGDGIMETVGIDSNNDGIIDTYHTELDTNGDGYIDTIIEGNDYDQDGLIESQTVYHDYDHDHVYEEVIKSFDSDGDGRFDMVNTYYDSDGDGNEDLVIKEEYYDQDGDGRIDTYVINTDIDGDGVFDAIEVHNIDAETGYVELNSVQENYNGNISGAYADELENFDPANADMSCVSGNPVQSMKEWEYQGNTGRCALYTQKFVIEELTGTEINIDELARFAEENGWFAEESGTPLLNMGKILDCFGIQSDMSFHNDIMDIQKCLESGGKVIVAIDADEIWYGEEDDLFTPGDGANHAVEVIGIDRTNPEEPMVILNDSGNPNGCGEMVPMDVFVDAWEDGNCQMIACM